MIDLSLYRLQPKFKRRVVEELWYDSRVQIMFDKMPKKEPRIPPDEISF